jgi:hypothetical protein
MSWKYNINEEKGCTCKTGVEIISGKKKQQNEIINKTKNTWEKNVFCDLFYIH